MIKKIIMGIILITSIVVLCGCSSGIKYKIGYDNNCSFGSKEVGEGITFGTLAFVSSLQEMKDLCDEWNNPAFKENSENYSSELSVKIRTYNEDYFKEKALIIYHFTTGRADKTQIKSILVEESQLVLNVRITKKIGTYTQEALFWLRLIEVNKADTVGVNDVVIKKQ